MIKTTLVAALMVALSVAVLAAASPETTDAPAALPVIEGRQVRTYEGFTRPSRQTAVASRVAGLVDKVTVAEGQTVRAGEPLVQLDSTAERLEVEMSRMAVEESKDLQAAELVAKQAASELQRAEALLTKNAITENELEQRQLALKVAQLRVEAARSNSRMAAMRLQRDEALLQQRTITAPNDGIVVKVLKQRGEAVERLETVVELVQLDPLEIVLNMPAATRPLYKVGQAAQVLLEGSDLPQKGTVTLVDATIDFASGTYRLKIQVPNGGGTLTSGVRARVSLAPAAAEE